MRKIRTFDTIEKECTWCHNKFVVTWKYRHQEMCSRKCMYEWRKSTNWEDVICKNCKKPFKRRIHARHYITGKKRMFCCNHCSVTSEYKKRKLRKWGLSSKNHWNKRSVQEKVGKTKLQKYGDANYNNPEKTENTMMQKYGVKTAFQLNPSNGHPISKPQRKVFNQVKKTNPDALIEQFLNDAKVSVDILIPSKKKVVEVYGDYWHMNPIKYKETDYNKTIKLTAKEIWDRDTKRVELLKSYGYDVSTIWENDINNKKFDIYIK